MVWNNTTGEYSMTTWRKANKEKALAYGRNYRATNLKAWADSGIVPLVTKCEICGRTIYFKSDKKKNTINFDHRHGEKHTIWNSPKSWLASHPPSEKHIQIWKSNDFGCLCLNCNYCIPTYGRERYIENMIRYVFNGVKKLV